MAALWDPQQKLQRQPVVAPDEAHLLSPPLLEEIRFLTNHQMDSASPVAVCLVGQAELRRKLGLQVFAAIYQHTKGIPRQVDNLCPPALLAGYAAQRKVIEESTVKQALLELQDEIAGQNVPKQERHTAWVMARQGA